MAFPPEAISSTLPFPVAGPDVQILLFLVQEGILWLTKVSGSGGELSC